MCPGALPRPGTIKGPGALLRPGTLKVPGALPRPGTVKGPGVQVAVVGGGAGGVELALSLHHFLGLPRRDAGPTPTSSPAQVT